MKKIKVGLLPLYLKLYDDTMPERRSGFVSLLKAVKKGFADNGMDFVMGDVCRVKNECDAAVRRFEQLGVEMIVTLHLAYSPSLESIRALAGTTLPILILDTTMDHSFGRGVNPDRIMYNHGIHGVMDLASMLKREGKDFQIVAGPVGKSDVIERAAGIIRARRAATEFMDSRVLRIGRTFKGMGDFSVPAGVLEDQFGIRVKEISPAALADQVAKVGKDEVAAEMAADRKQYACALDKDVHARSVRVGLGVRRTLEAGKFNAFSMNFNEFRNADGPVNTVPFLEASKAMARGVGYAGEGDVLTAALVGALERGFGRTTFTEIFCPDWQGGTLFLSHMGEINPEISSGKPRLIEKPFPFTPAQNPAILACAPKAGPAVFVNIVPGPKDGFELIAAPVKILADATNPKMKSQIRGWMKPAMDVSAFLEEYSRLGGTHHSALVLGTRADSVAQFAQYIGLQCHIIQ